MTDDDRNQRIAMTAEALAATHPHGTRWTGTHAGVLTDEPGPYQVVGYLPGNPVFRLIVVTGEGNIALADPDRMGLQHDVRGRPADAADVTWNGRRVGWAQVVDGRVHLVVEDQATARMLRGPLDKLSIDLRP